jgi:20S proteasome alpha/beta subunit
MDSCVHLSTARMFTLVHVCLQSITSHNGSAVLAMVGDHCVGIAADRRYGINLQTVGTDFTRLFRMGSHTYLGLAGLATDVQTVYVSQSRQCQSSYQLDY